MNTHTIEGGRLLALVERIERGEDDKRAAADAVKAVYAEAKGAGYDVAVMRKIVAARRQDQNQRREQDEIFDLYMQQIGMPV